jgi:hypothetical protein
MRIKLRVSSVHQLCTSRITKAQIKNFETVRNTSKFLESSIIAHVHLQEMHTNGTENRRISFH